MTDAFPPHDASLDANTFQQAYTLIAQAIHDETPDSVADPFHRMPSYQEMVGEALAPLNKWRSYAFDGDPAQLPHQSGAPWTDLDNARIRYLDDLVEKMSSIGDGLSEHWSGDGAQDYSQYMHIISGRLKNYAGEDGYVAQVSAALQDAFAVRTAFKKDLLELARGAYEKIKSIDDGSAAGELGMLCLMLGSMAFEDIAAITATATVAKKVFGKLLTTVNGKVLETSEKKVFFHGDLPRDIMKSFDEALGRVVDGHAHAAKALATRMQRLYDQLCTAADERYYPAIPVIDTSHIPSFSKHFFPR